jgi:O-methyltransferase involved in polyketide biosynthesis
MYITCYAAPAAAVLLSEDMWSKLLAAGLSTTTPTVWVLEGFIGAIYQS